MASTLNIAEPVSIPGASTLFPLRSRYVAGDRKLIDEILTRSDPDVARRGDMVASIISRIEVRTPGECWPWKGRVNDKGYGEFPVKVERGSRNNRHFLAHRLAYDLAKGQVPEGMVIRHQCHNPLCCNPAHLDVGTHADNMQDMVDAGRSTAGEKNPKARLTAEQARAICRRYYEDGATLKEIAAELGVHLATVGYITQGKTWGDATIDIREEFEERAAIMQHMGGMSQEAAESAALKRVLDRKKRSKARTAKLGVAS